MKAPDSTCVSASEFLFTSYMGIAAMTSSTWFGIQRRAWTLGALGAGVFVVLAFGLRSPRVEASTPAASPAIAVSVAAVTTRNVTTWDEFSGRVESIERVAIRSRVSGPVLTVHFREGELVKKDDLLITIDPAPYAAQAQYAQAQVAVARERNDFTKSEFQRAQRLLEEHAVSQREYDSSSNAYREAEAGLLAAEAALQSARLNLQYTQVRAPVAGRVGRLEVTVGNLVAAGPTAPVLTTLFSVDPIYASFEADESVVAQALDDIQGDASSGRGRIEQIPVQMKALGSGGALYSGHLQLVDNRVDEKSGTVRVRAVFPNANGRLMDGQFAQLRLGQVKARSAILVSEKAVGTDQNKRYVMVVGPDNHVAYREITLGAQVDGLRIVTSGLKDQEKVVVNGLQRVQPGALVAPTLVPMEASGDKSPPQNS